MVNVNEAFPSNWVSAHDLKGKDVTLIICKSNVQDLGKPGEQDRKLCIWFNGTEKGMALNVINRNTIIDLYGPETDNWHGESITLYPTQTEWKSKMVDCIRIRTETPAKTESLGSVEADAIAASIPSPPIDDSGIPF